MKTTIKQASVVGLLPAIIEAILIYFVEPAINKWILVQAVLFWFTCGFTVFLIDIKISEIFKSVLFTVFLNLPWYIAESVSKEKPEHLIPLIIASIIQGLVIGLLSKKLKTGKFIANLKSSLIVLLMFLFLGCNPGNDKKLIDKLIHRQGQINEWAPFFLADNANKNDLFSASDNLQKEFLSVQNRFLKSPLFKSEGWQWVDFVYWNTKDDAEIAAKNKECMVF